MKITIGHLYPDLLNLYGDRGNIQCLMKRCQWRGIEAETIPFELDDKIDFSKLDIVLLGGGSDREQMIVCEKLQKIQPDFKAYVEDNGVVIAICGGYQLLAKCSNNKRCIMVSAGTSANDVFADKANVELGTAAVDEEPRSIWYFEPADEGAVSAKTNKWNALPY